MSGGHFDCDYSYFNLGDFAKKIREEGNILFAELVKDVANLLKEYDWWKAGDTSREDFMKAWKSWQDKWQDNTSEELTAKEMEKTVHMMIWDSLGLPPDEMYEEADKERREY